MDRRQFMGIALPLAAGLAISPASSLEALTASETKNKVNELKQLMQAQGVDPRYFESPKFQIYPDVIKLSNPKDVPPMTEAQKKAAEARAKRKFEEKLAWYQAEGEKFYPANEALLKEAESETGPNRFYIAAILGIESNYTTYVGKHLAFNALASLYFSKREKFRNLSVINIPDLVTFSESHGLEYASPDGVKHSGVFVPASWAGALGFGQFMPMNLTNGLFISKVPGKAPNPFDLHDCTVSIGNYLARNGWDANKNDLKPVFKKGNGRAIYHYNNDLDYFNYVAGIAEHLRTNFA